MTIRLANARPTASLAAKRTKFTIRLANARPTARLAAKRTKFTIYTVPRFRNILIPIIAQQKELSNLMAYMHLLLTNKTISQ